MADMMHTRRLWEGHDPWDHASPRVRTQGKRVWVRDIEPELEGRSVANVG